MSATDNVALVRRFFEACVRADPDEFASYFTEDAVWWNAPWTASARRTSAAARWIFKASSPRP
jgi:ketosteroid isomerase-like protein